MDGMDRHGGVGVGMMERANRVGTSTCWDGEIWGCLNERERRQSDTYHHPPSFDASKIQPPKHKNKKKRLSLLSPTINLNKLATMMMMNQKSIWRKIFSLCCLLAAVSGQSSYYDDNSGNYGDYDYQDYAGEQGYDDHLYHDYAARQQEKIGGGGGYVE